MNVYQKCYQKLEVLFSQHGGLEKFLRSSEPGFLKLQSKGFMDLNIDRLGPDRMALAHNFIQNGDVMADPDMEVKVDTSTKTAFGMTYQLSSLGIYQTVNDGSGHINAALRLELSSFLFQWLTNLDEQGFYRRAKNGI